VSEVILDEQDALEGHQIVFEIKSQSRTHQWVFSDDPKEDFDTLEKVVHKIREEMIEEKSSVN
jgi:hypothetical protein